jgi:catechol 2,3-dioxygenase-like lactoylglutathione lyase family enzyme
VFHHVTLRASDRAASERFYEILLATIEIARSLSDPDRAEWRDFWLVQATGEQPPTRRLHIGFVAPSHAHVDEFWQVGTEAGFRDDGVPGPRPEYGDDYYGSFLLDPDGNSAEAVHHDTLREGGAIDHLWIRVADVAGSKAFYEAVAPLAGFRLNHDSPERAQFKGTSGSFSVVAGTPSERVHMAFSAEQASALVDPDGNKVELLSR